MIIDKLCAPALTYLIFVLIHIINNLFKNKADNLLVYIVTSFLFIFILQVLCLKNLRFISWLLVFIPIIMYAYTTFIIFSIFGFNPNDRINNYLVKQ